MYPSQLVWAARSALIAALLIGWWVAVSPATSESTAWFAHSDKLRHAAAFAGFAVLAEWGRLRPWWLICGALLFYGVAVEWAQTSVPGRDASLADAVADAVGVGVGWWAARAVHHRWAQRFGIDATPRS